MAPDLRCNQHNRDQIPVMTTVHGAGLVHTSGGIQQTDRPQRSDSVDSNSGFNSLIIAARHRCVCLRELFKRVSPKNVSTENLQLRADGDFNKRVLEGWTWSSSSSMGALRKSVLEDWSLGRRDFPLPVPAGRAGLCVNKLAPITSAFPCHSLQRCISTFSGSRFCMVSSLFLIHSLIETARRLRSLQLSWLTVPDSAELHCSCPLCCCASAGAPPCCLTAGSLKTYKQQTWRSVEPPGLVKTSKSVHRFLNHRGLCVCGCKVTGSRLLLNYHSSILLQRHLCTAVACVTFLLIKTLKTAIQATTLRFGWMCYEVHDMSHFCPNTWQRIQKLKAERGHKAERPRQREGKVNLN